MKIRLNDLLKSKKKEHLDDFYKEVPCDFHNGCTHRTSKDTCQMCWAKDCEYHKAQEKLMQSFTPCDGINKWVREHVKTCQTHATAGEQFAFQFVPSGIVEVQTVKCLICKQSHTEYVD